MNYIPKCYYGVYGMLFGGMHPLKKNPKKPQKTHGHSLELQAELLIRRVFGAVVKTSELRMIANGFAAR